MTTKSPKTSKCEVCGADVAMFKAQCDGDGKIHYHGRVHTMLRGRGTNDLALVGISCGCSNADAQVWMLQREAVARWGDQVKFIGPNPGEPSRRWVLVAEQGVVGATLGTGETPRAAFETAASKGVKS